MSAYLYNVTCQRSVSRTQINLLANKWQLTTASCFSLFQLQLIM